MEWALGVGFARVTTQLALEFLYLELAVPKLEAATHDVARLITKFKARWIAVGRRKDRFVQQYAEWLVADFCFPDPICRPRDEEEPAQGSFRDLSRRSKLRATEGLRQNSSHELSFAAASAFYRKVAGQWRGPWRHSAHRGVAHA